MAASPPATHWSTPHGGLGRNWCRAILRNYALQTAYVGGRRSRCAELRVLVLPYLEESKLYEQFHLDEQWDSDQDISCESAGVRGGNAHGADAWRSRTSNWCRRHEPAR